MYAMVVGRDDKTDGERRSVNLSDVRSGAWVAAGPPP